MLQKISSGEIKIAIIGLGYVGLPLAVEYGKKYDTVGFDVKESRLNELRCGCDSTLETSSEDLKSAIHLHYSNDPSDLKDRDIFIVTVPTPVDKYNRPDLTPLYKASETVGKVMKHGAVIIYESTVFPGCTEEECVPVLEKYSGIKKFMDNIVEETKEKGYVETLFHRRRYIPELSSNNYMVRQFGARAAMNTPIQGTAADIMKIAMINVFNKIKEEKLENEAKIVLQVHDELIIECKKEKQEKVEEILKQEMENAMKLKVPLKVEISEANNWYEAK